MSKVLQSSVLVKFYNDIKLSSIPSKPNRILENLPKSASKADPLELFSGVLDEAGFWTEPPCDEVDKF